MLLGFSLRFSSLGWHDRCCEKLVETVLKAHAVRCRFGNQIALSCLGLVLATWSVGPVRASVVFTNIMSFDGTNGNNSSGPLLQIEDGSFYGTSQGFPGYGTVFNLSQSGVMKTAGSFCQTNGSDPGGPLVRTADGTIYGTTWLGGVANSGTIFRLSPDGAIETLMAFNGTNGSSPRGLILGPDGAFYGVTAGGGLNGQQGGGFGTIFRIDTNGVFKTLVNFNGTNGIVPQFLILGKARIFYGSTHLGGTLFESSPSGYGGNGTVFKMDQDGTLTTLFSFSGTNGACPGGITEARDGNLYGVTEFDGPNLSSDPPGNGAAFCLTTNGAFTKLAEFNAQGYSPFCIVQAWDGNFYGTTFGPNGSIFQLTPKGLLTIVYNFANVSVPNYLTAAVDGSLYGLTMEGGVYSQGSIFRLTILPDPPLLQLVSQASSFFNFTWNTSPGRSYQVQHAGDLGYPAWTNLGDPILATNATASFSATTNPNTSHLYRVVLLP
jgi:uncharacterized repeat protein (TIGR03803 family)